MRIKTFFALLAAAVIFSLTGSTQAAGISALTLTEKTFTTADGVLSIEVSREEWEEVKDDQHWLSIGNGADVITVDHFALGEALPQAPAADAAHPLVYQGLISTENEVFLVQASAASRDNLASLLQIISTIHILQFDTKTALVPAAAEQPVGEGTSLARIDAARYVVADTLNVRGGASAEAELLGTVSYGNSVQVLGAVLENGKENGWLQISYNGAIGYVSAEYVSENKPAEKAPEETKEKATEETKEKATEKATEKAPETKTIYAEDGSTRKVSPKNGSDMVWEDADGNLYELFSRDPDVVRDYDGDFWAFSTKFWEETVTKAAEDEEGDIAEDEVDIEDDEEIDMEEDEEAVDMEEEESIEEDMNE